MADYRFSAKVIKRSNGQSAVASSAYRSATRLCDERTGQTCDYSRKSGVIHSEVMAPEATPDWMHDRAQLWNAVEAVERRKDAQLAREVQLSLPHELTDAQRHDLVRGFVQEQFVGKGMIADLAIHAPSREGDRRNHHAHVMLTMRELAGDGFGNKAREWNATDQLEQWREQWAHHQNRALERHGHPARVDHRSFEARGIDREPTQHLGPVASDMERKGKASRIGDENRQAHTNNIERIADYVERAEVLTGIDYQKAKLAEWSEQKRRELENAQDLAKLDLAQKHDRQKSNLEAQLAERHATLRATIHAELQAVERRLEATGVRKLLRVVFRQDRTDQQARDDLNATLANIAQREAEERQALTQRQEAERRKDARRRTENKDRLERGIQKATQRREKENWTPTSPRGPKRGTQRTGRPDRAKKAKPAPAAPSKKPDNTLAPPTPFDKRKAVTAPKKPTPKTADPKAAPKRDPITKTIKGWFDRATQQPKGKPTPPPKEQAKTQRKPTTKTAKRFAEKARPAPESKPIGAPDLASEKSNTDRVLDKYRADAKRPWDSAIKSNDNNRRPWESDLGREAGDGEGRERSPSSGGPKNSKG